MKKTKILCTIGPSSMEPATMRRMIESGMNAIRINTSHGDFRQYDEIISNLRSISDLPVLLDTKGPEVRIRCEKEYHLKKGETVTIGFSDSHPIYFDHDFLDKTKIGTPILINDGLLQLRVVQKKPNALVLRALNSESIQNGKRLNLPTVHLGMPILSERDKKVIQYAQRKKVEYVALSFTSKPEEARDVKRLLRGGRTKVIAKIENQEGVRNFQKILTEVDGIMVARGDLGIEIASERLPLLQKRFINECNEHGKIVITATQMLRSMVSSPTPTRAETSDVANAILDGTDAIMLSEESAVGSYPIEAVRVMSRIAKQIEPHVRSNLVQVKTLTISDAITKSIFELVKSYPIDKIVTFTRTGYTASMISRLKLQQEIIAVTSYDEVKRQLSLNYGVIPVLIKYRPVERGILFSVKQLLKTGLLKKDDTVLFTSGSMSKVQTTNMISISRVSDVLKYSL